MSQEPPQIHTYHCLCSTLLLATPYALSSLPRRAPPSLDHAYILPLPSLSSLPSSITNTTSTTNTAEDHANVINSTNDKQKANSHDQIDVLPSLLTPNLRPARKLVVVRREDGFEKRKVLRCARCGIGVGYEILGEEKDGDKARVLYLLEGCLVETEEMGKEDGAV